MADNGRDPVLELIELAFADDELRCRLLADMPGTLARLGRSLSDGQMGELARALDEGGEAFAAGLDQRLSQSGVSLSPQALLQQSKKKASRERDEVEISAAGQSFASAKARREAPARSEGAGACPTISAQGGDYDQDEPDYEVEKD